MKKLFIIVGIFSFLLLGCQNQEQTIKTISADTLHQEQLENESMLILDVRSSQEFKQGHIKDALNIPVESIDQESMKLYNKNTKIVVYCRSGNRSSQAALKLKELGFKLIYDLGGLNNWNYDLVKDTNNN